jgi:prefoldin subunit 5
MLNEELPVAISQLAGNINALKVRLQKLQQELDELSTARAEAEAAYKMTLTSDAELDFECAH